MTDIGTMRRVREKYVSSRSPCPRHKTAGPGVPLFFWDPYLCHCPNGLTYSDQI